MPYNKEKTLRHRISSSGEFDLLRFTKRLNSVQVIYSLHFLNNRSGLCIHQELL